MSLAYSFTNPKEKELKEKKVIRKEGKENERYQLRKTNSNSHIPTPSKQDTLQKITKKRAEYLKNYQMG